MRKRLRELKYQLNIFARVILNQQRKQPDFFILGTQKGGTTSLFHYLSNNPAISSPILKEIHYFNNREHSYIRHDLKWYLAHFPLQAQTGITGESTPDYFDHPLVPMRIKRLYPNARFILLLRDPVERMFSNFKHRTRKGVEDRSFNSAFGNESNDLVPELEKIKKDENYFSHIFHNHAYLHKSLYGQHMALWYEHFNKDQFLILKSEDFFADPRSTLRRVEAFLGVAHYSYTDEQLRIFNPSKSSTLSGKNLDPDLYQRIKDDQQLLTQLLGYSLFDTYQ